MYGQVDSKSPVAVCLGVDQVHGVWQGGISEYEGSDLPCILSISIGVQPSSLEHGQWQSQ